MKRYIALIFLITAVLAFAVNYKSIREIINPKTEADKNSNEINDIKQPDENESAKELVNSFTVLVESDEVLYGDGVEYKTITEEEITLPNKTFIKTLDGTAQILLANNSVITLDANTEIQIDTEEKKTSIVQLYGNTWHRVKSIVEVGEYVVKTDNTIAAVRGTVFSVNVDENGSTDVHVVEHEVEVTKGVKVGDDWIDEEVNLIKEGGQARVLAKKIAERKMEIMQSTQEFKDSKWFTENRNNDELLKLEKREEVKKYMKEKMTKRRVLQNNRTQPNLKDVVPNKRGNDSRDKNN